MPQVGFKSYKVDDFEGAGFLFNGNWYCFPAGTNDDTIRRACFITDGKFTPCTPDGIVARGLDKGPVEYTFEVIEEFDLAKLEGDPVVVGFGQDNRGDLVVFYKGEWYGFTKILQEPFASLFGPEDVVRNIVKGYCRPASDVIIEERGLKFPETISHIGFYDKSQF